jgi:dihydroorotase
MTIDVHVHCRDWRQKNKKETVEHALSVAAKAGLSAIFDMPNSDPPILTLDDVVERLKLVPKNSTVWYGVYVGLTSDSEQVRKAVDAFDKNEHVVAFKMYAGRSVGGLTVGTESDQRLVYATLAEAGYDGVVAVHAEDESLFGEPFVPENPVTHARERRPVAEAISVYTQIRFAEEAGLKKLHITHTSCPESVDIISSYKGPVSVTCDVTPHHLLLSEEHLNGPKGLLFKMNPPLRDLRRVEQMFEYLKAGKITMIGTDHAPHTKKDKLEQPYLSGIPGLHIWPRFLAYLGKKGFTRGDAGKFAKGNGLLGRLTHNNVMDTFQPRVKLELRQPDGSDLSHEYWYDPYEGII